MNTIIAAIALCLSVNGEFTITCVSREVEYQIYQIDGEINCIKQTGVTHVTGLYKSTLTHEELIELLQTLHEEHYKIVISNIEFWNYD